MFFFFKDSRIKTLEKELEMFEWEYSKLKDEFSMTSSSNESNYMMKSENDLSLVNDKSKSESKESINIPIHKSATDTEKEVCHMNFKTKFPAVK